MPTSSSRDAAWAVVNAYQAAALRELFVHVADALRQLDAGEIDPFEVDAVMFQHSRAAKEVWKFCNGVNVRWIAEDIEAGRAPKEWWSRGAFRRR